MPHDEKIIFETLVDLIKFNNNNYKKIFSLLTPYIEEIKNKQFFIINDLIIIKYVLMYIIKNKHYSHQNDFKKIAEILLSKEQKNSISITDFYLFRDVLFLILHISFYYSDLQLIHRINKILDSELFYFEDTKKISIYYLFKWKECLLIKNQENTAKTYYKNAIMASELMQRTYLREIISLEWKIDETKIQNKTFLSCPLSSKLYIIHL